MKRILTAAILASSLFITPAFADSDRDTFERKSEKREDRREDRKEFETPKFEHKFEIEDDHKHGHVSSVPEPTSAVMLLAGLAVMALIIRRRSV
jgi:hypothetical protein